MNRSLIIACLLASALFVAGCSYSYSPYDPPPAAFSGDSDKAVATVVVPAMDTPVPKGKNIIWCGTMKLAYDAWKSRFGPITVEQAKEACARMDACRLTTRDLPDGSYYVAVGTAKENIDRKIRSEMARRFKKSDPTLPAGADAIAYCYLAANVKFAQAFVDRPGSEEFVDSSGKNTPVSTFGMPNNPDSGAARELADQIDVLYAKGEGHLPAEFALDLDKNSRDSQLILACVQPKETLRDTWQDVQKKIDSSKPSAFTTEDHLAVPNVAYKIDHRFKEFEADQRMLAFQMVDFRLDKSGATLVSEAFVASGGIGDSRSFNFTRPFLVAMRKRGASEPYFVMWVDNAELLCRK